mmetsp:Transcript_21773/g.69517  ORF Transcript_21773/g.69517 Transcript_21773/m.69517 type:complete len:262 (+) Transcript_21773:461-1246(+)
MLLVGGEGRLLLACRRRRRVEVGAVVQVAEPKDVVELRRRRQVPRAQRGGRLSEHLGAVLVAPREHVRVGREVARDEGERGGAEPQPHDEPAFVAQHPSRPARRCARHVHFGDVGALRGFDVHGEAHLPQPHVPHRHVPPPEPPRQHLLPFCVPLAAASALFFSLLGVADRRVGRAGRWGGLVGGVGGPRLLGRLRRLLCHRPLLLRHRPLPPPLARLVGVLLRADDDDVLIEPIRQRMRELCSDRLGVADVPGETSDGER